MKAEELLKICWLVANIEAKNLGAVEIEPIHFLLAVMKIIDPEFPNMLDKLNIASEEWGSMCKEAVSIRHYIDVKPERVTEKRRRLRSRLASARVNAPILKEGMLHRSEKLKKAFSDAAMLSGGDVLKLSNVVESLFELNLVTLDDIDKA